MEEDSSNHVHRPTLIFERSDNFSGFTLERKLGEGSYGKVREARCNLTGNKYAVKIVSKKKVSVRYLKKFLPREVKCMSLVDHPNIIRLIKVVDAPLEAFIVMELASTDLLTHLQANSLSESQCRKIYTQLLSALSHCHSRLIVHRDLKLENILLDHDMNVKLTDFGFAKELSENFHFTATSCGSQSYVAPEVSSGLIYDAYRAEMWSLGVILYALVTRELPFSQGALQRLHITRSVELAFSPEVLQNSDLVHLITGLLTFDPMKRMTLAEALQHPWIVKKGSSISLISSSRSSSLSRQRPIPVIESHVSYLPEAIVQQQRLAAEDQQSSFTRARSLKPQRSRSPTPSIRSETRSRSQSHGQRRRGPSFGKNQNASMIPQDGTPRRRTYSAGRRSPALPMQELRLKDLGANPIVASASDTSILPLLSAGRPRLADVCRVKTLAEIHTCQDVIAARNRASRRWKAKNTKPPTRYLHPKNGARLILTTDC